MTSVESTSARPPTRRHAGPKVAIGLVVFILALASIAGIIHQQNIRARSLAREDAEAAEAAERAPATP